MWAAAISCIGSHVATRPGSRPWCCTVARAQAARHGSLGYSTRRPTGSSCSTSATAGVARRTRSAPRIDLGNNTTPNLVGDIERLRTHLRVERWLVIGGSWGSALALAYAERHPDRVTAMVLWGVASARRSEVPTGCSAAAWVPSFPSSGSGLRNAVPEELRGIDVVDAYRRMLFDADPEIRASAAYEWCNVGTCYAVLASDLGLSRAV